MFNVYVSKKRTTDITPEFSGREHEVISLCRDGLMSKEIAAHLNISLIQTTVFNHRFRKWASSRTTSRIPLSRYAIRCRS